MLQSIERASEDVEKLKEESSGAMETDYVDTSDKEPNVNFEVCVLY